MRFMYPAIFSKDDNCYTVEFPGLIGCQTFGDTLEEAMGYAQEALAGYLLTILEDETIPNLPTEIRDIKTEDESFVSLVVCNIDQYREPKLLRKPSQYQDGSTRLQLIKTLTFLRHYKKPC